MDGKQVSTKTVNQGNKNGLTLDDYNSIANSSGISFNNIKDILGKPSSQKEHKGSKDNSSYYQLIWKNISPTFSAKEIIMTIDTNSVNNPDDNYASFRINYISAPKNVKNIDIKSAAKVPKDYTYDDVIDQLGAPAIDSSQPVESDNVMFGSDRELIYFTNSKDKAYVISFDESDSSQHQMTDKGVRKLTNKEINEFYTS